jgi:hypothetical protein
MVKWLMRFVLLLIGALAIWAAFHFYPTEEKNVKKQFGLLADYASKEGSEAPLTTARKLKDLGSLFAERCGLEVSIYSLSGTYSRGEIAFLAARSRSYFSELQLRFYDLEVSFPKKETAKVTGTGMLMGKILTGEDMDEPHELQCLLKKVENRWLFSHIQVVEVLKK